MSVKDFIQRYHQYAQSSQAAGIFPAVSLAIAYLESNRSQGISKLASQYNNFHGIQVYPKWKGKTVRMTDNQTGSVRTFCVYPSIAAGFRGFIEFLQVNPRYGAAGVFQAQTPKEQITRIARAGYSESGQWSKLVQVISMQVPGRKSNQLEIFFLVCGLFISFALFLPDWKPGRYGK